MSPKSKATGLVLHLNSEDTDAEYLDQLTRQLLQELQDFDGVETADLVKGGPVASGAKSSEAVTLGQIAVVVLPALLPKLIEFVQAWVMRGQKRSIDFEGEISGQKIKFRGSAEELSSLLASLQHKTTS